MLPEIMGYRRPDGRFGIRNHIAVIATMDNANPTVRRICSLVKGCVPFCPGFVLPDIAAQLSELENQKGLSDEERDRKSVV